MFAIAFLIVDIVVIRKYSAVNKYFCNTVIYFMANKVGRPRTAVAKARLPGISVRLTLSECDIIHEAVRRSGIRSKSEWARKALLHVANHGTRIT